MFALSGKKSVVTENSRRMLMLGRAHTAVYLCRSIYVLDAKHEYCRTRRLAGHSSTIRSLDWSNDGKFISSMDQAYESLVFDVTKGKVSKDTHRDEPWVTWTNVLGFAVMGIWPDYSDGTDINAAHRSPCGKYIVTSDDAGKVARPVAVRYV